MKKFADFAKDNIAPQGDKIKLEEILNKEIEITNYKINESKYTKGDCSKCLTLQFKLSGNLKILFTGSNVLMEQIELYKDEIPFSTTIVHENKYYKFT